MIRVFVGTDSDIHGDAEKVLEYSIRTNTPEEVELTFMRPGWKTGVTGFTTHRFLIPEMCNYEGYAIYVDVDMIAVGNLRELWDCRMPGKWCITRPGEDDVSVIDCSAFRDLPTEQQLKQFSGRQGRVMKQRCKQIIGNRYSVTIPETWNVEDKIVPGMQLIHYTNLNTQPWHPDPNHNYAPHASQEAVDLFFEYLERANSA